MSYSTLLRTVFFYLLTGLLQGLSVHTDRAVLQTAPGGAEPLGEFTYIDAWKEFQQQLSCKVP